MLSSALNIKADPDVVSCTFGEGSALLDLRSGQYFTVNSVGAYVWSLLDAPISIRDIVAAVLERYDADRERCARDIEALIGDMLNAKLIRASDAPAS